MNSLFSSIKKGWLHRKFFRFSLLARAGFWYSIEKYALKRTISYPKLINLNITDRCNLKCQICHSLTNQSKTKNLSQERWLDFIDNCASFSPDWFISGGEPFLYKNLPELINSISDKNMYVSVVSNGTIVNEEQLKKINQGALKCVFFSILGIREKHDQMVGIPNSYKKIQKAISLFAKIHPKTSIFLNVPMSYDLLSDLATLNKDFKDLPITAIRLSQLNFLTSKELHAHGAVAEKNHLKIKTPVSFLTDDSHQDLGQLIQSSNFEELTIPWHHDVNLTHDEVSSWYNSCFSSQRVCNFSWHSLFVYPNGEIKSCQFLQEPFGNVFEDNIIEVWNSEEYNRFRNLVGSKLLPGCSRCCKL